MTKVTTEMTVMSRLYGQYGNGVGVGSAKAVAMPIATAGGGSQPIAVAASRAAAVAVTCGSAITVRSWPVTARFACTHPGDRDQPPAA